MVRGGWEGLERGCWCGMVGPRGEMGEWGWLGGEPWWWLRGETGELRVRDMCVRVVS